MIRTVESPANWTGPAIDYRSEGMHLLDAADLAEIEAALAHLRGLGNVDFPEITTGGFPLPRLGAVLRGQCDALRNGRGFLLLRGLPRERYSMDDMARIYFGLGAYFGRPIPQSWQGELLASLAGRAARPRDRHRRPAGGCARLQCRRRAAHAHG